jgi:uncharacterized membrane protein (UPF0127 family)
VISRPNLRLSLLVLALAATSLVAGGACKNTTAPRPTSVAPGQAAAAAVVVDTGEHEVTYRVEVARTPTEHERGLMFRRYLAADAGMIFLFDRPSVQTFWMKNTLIPLDMVFIDSDLRIVGIVANAEPQTETVRAVDEPSQYVLELAGGIAAKDGLRPGQRVEFQGVGPSP